MISILQKKISIHFIFADYFAQTEVKADKLNQVSFCKNFLKNSQSNGTQATKDFFLALHSRMFISKIASFSSSFYWQRFHCAFTGGTCDTFVFDASKIYQMISFPILQVGQFLKENLVKLENHNLAIYSR